MPKNEELENVLRQDREWQSIDSKLCKVVSFDPSETSMENGRIVVADRATPYASLVLECEDGRRYKGFVTQKIDFANLWRAFRERGVSKNEEVIIAWSNTHYKYRWLKLFSVFLPKLRVMICPRGAFELMTDKNFKPELSGEVRWNAQKPIIEWKPEVMERIKIVWRG